jgi:flagellar hook protein FlgE
MALPLGNIMSSTAGLSGLYANQQALGVAAHNIANTSTQHFQPRQASFQEAQPAGSGVTLSVEGRGLARAEGLSSEDLATDITNALVYKQSFALNAKVIQFENERVGTLLDTKA